VSCLDAHSNLVSEAGVIDLVGVVILDPFKSKNSDGWMIDLEIGAIHRHKTPAAIILDEPAVKINLV